MVYEDTCYICIVEFPGFWEDESLQINVYINMYCKCIAWADIQDF